MKISTKGRYGTRAMVDIGNNYGNGPVSLRELAERGLARAARFSWDRVADETESVYRSTLQAS